MVSFVHLQTHTEYSIHEGILKIKEMSSMAKEDGMKAVAITDLSNVFAWVKFYQTMVNCGIKPLIGSELTIVDDKKSYRIIALAKSIQGYQQLIHVITYAYQHSVLEHEPALSLPWLLSQKSLDWVVISPGRLGVIEHGEHEVKKWADHFPDAFYLGLHRCMDADRIALKNSLEMACKLDLPVVALNAVCFSRKSDYQAHEARVCVNHGELLGHGESRYSNEQYFKTQKEMVELFQDMPAAIENSVIISQRCTVKMDFSQTYLPEIVPDGYSSVDDYFEKSSYEGLEERLELLQVQDRKPYDDRLKIEIDIIKKMGFCSYFMIVADFIQWSKNNNIPVGPGRGSGAGSLVAYVLGITELDPLEYQLLFERFLNPERVSMPDFDIDFCMIGRDRVIEYVASKYGRENVAQIITYGTMAAKAVIRDVGRVMGQPYGFVDKIAKLVPFEVGMTLEKAINQEPMLANMIQSDDVVSELMGLCRKLEGVARNVGRHAGGVVIAPKPLHEFTALYCESDGSNLVTQFDKDDIEKIGLVKFDFLGLRTLTIIQWAIENIQKQHGVKIDINTIPLKDKTTFVLLQKCATDGVFQLESQGFKDLIRRLKPDCLEDLIALVALFRPGPLQSGMVDDFVDRKHGRAEVTYLHPELEPILSTTYGVILYQEQVMKIAQVLAGYTLGAADLLRRAMGKKKPEEMVKQRAIFMEGSEKHGVDGNLAGQIFDLMEKFAGYGFNKSHSAAYALISYQTAWLKANYTEAFMAAVLSSDMDNTDKVLHNLRATESCGVKVLPPNIHSGEYRFTVVKDKTILYGLGAIKGLGHQVIEDILQAREVGGHFKDILDLCSRVKQRLNRRTLEALISSGALDDFKVDRGVMFASVDKALKHRDQVKEEQKHGQLDLFSASQGSGSIQNFEYVQVEKWTLIEFLKHERDALGFYLSGHPTKQYAKEYSSLGLSSSGRLARIPKGTIYYLGQLQGMRVMANKQGKRFAFATLIDFEGQVDVLFTESVMNHYRELLQNDSLLVIEGTCSKDDYSNRCRIRAQSIKRLDELRESKVKYLKIVVENTKAFEDELKRIHYVLKRFDKGSCHVKLFYTSSTRHVKFDLEDYAVEISDECIKTLKGIPCVKSIETVFS